MQAKNLLVIIYLMVSSQVMAMQVGWGVTTKDEKGKVKIGGRLQGMAVSNNEEESQDFFMRRTRLNLEYKPWDGHKFVYDIRNDDATKGDKGENKFVIGDAYWQLDSTLPYIKNFKFFRGKVDVSYTQTSSSKNLFDPNRNLSAEIASDYVVLNRRANNAQVNGNVGDLSFHFVLADGADSSDMEDKSGDDLEDFGGKINHQKFTYGGKLRYHFIGDAKKNATQDTFYGVYDQVSLGLGMFKNDAMNISNTTQTQSISRTLTNIDISVSLGQFRFLSEFFVFENFNLDWNDLDNQTTASGNYAQVEYFVNDKIAPYVAMDTMNYDPSEDNFAINTTTIGVNYYQNMEAMRFGINYKKANAQENVGDDISENYYAYIMLNF